MKIGLVLRFPHKSDIIFGVDANLLFDEAIEDKVPFHEVITPVPYSSGILGSQCNMDTKSTKHKGVHKEALTLLTTPNSRSYSEEFQMGTNYSKED